MRQIQFEILTEKFYQKNLTLCFNKCVMLLFLVDNMLVTLLLIICSGLFVITGSSISVLPSSEVWEGDQLVIKCTVESEDGVIWVREPFSDEEEIVVRELIAHHEHVLVEDQRYKVESGTENGAVISVLKVRKSVK